MKKEIRVFKNISGMGDCSQQFAIKYKNPNVSPYQAAALSGKFYEYICLTEIDRRESKRGSRERHYIWGGGKKLHRLDKK